MSKKYKVKHYYGKDSGFYRAKPHPLFILFLIAALAGLGFLGTVIYEPVYSFIMNINKQDDAPAPVSSEAAPRDEAEAGASSVPEPSEPEPPVYGKLKAVYAPHEVVSDSSRWDAFLSGLGDTGINAVMIDVKNSDGMVLFKTANAKAAEWNAVAADAVDLKAITRTLEEKGFSLIVRMPVFRDPLAASKGRRDYAIGYRGEPSFLWLDNAASKGGKPWLNPYSKLTQEYIDSLGRELAACGARMIVLDALRFPDNSSTNAVFNPEETEPAESRAAILKNTLSRLTAIAEEKGVRLATFYTAMEPTLSQNERDRYGGPVLDVFAGAVMLDVRPALFGRDYSGAGLEIVKPLENPAGAVIASLNYVKAGLRPDTEMIPCIQGGNAEGFNGGISYGKEQVDAQIKAVTDLGYEEYLLYSADGVYFVK